MNDKFVSWEDAVYWLREQPEHLELVRACYYDDPLISAAQRYYDSSEWHGIREIIGLGKDKPALDLGAGRGITSFSLAYDGWSVTALEPDPSSLVGAGAIRSLSDEADQDISVVEEWGESLPFDDETFDLVFCRQVLHHAADLEQFCREAYRVLKPEGKFLAVREHVISRQEDLSAFQREHPLHGLYGGENAFLLGEYKKSFNRAGFQLSCVLNPFESEINLFPETKIQLKQRLLKKVYLPKWFLVPNFILHSLGNLIRTPGRLYTFMGTKG